MMRLIRFGIPFAVLVACTQAPPAGTASTPRAPTVSLEAGALAGAVDSSGVLLFRGIPYATPPVGDLRWRPPAPVAHWSGTRSAARAGKNCVQDAIYGDIDPFAAGISEDCLNLNVWTTDLNASARKPVMVWIYGGGYNAGYADEPRHYGAHLAQKGVVVVALNYRLGVFGFFAHPGLAAESPNASAGNYAILDQIAALEWVRDNIAQFGGDPSRVTIFGESAGGSSVASLMASPLAKGLFHRAILQSGNAIGSARRKDSVYAEGVRFATLLGAPNVDVGTIARLRAIPTDSLMRASRPSDGKGGFTFVFNPRLVRDGWVLPLSVDSALSRGTANVVPVIVGATGDEGDAAYASARAFARLVTAQREPAYLYLFTRVGDDSVNRKRGAYHSADIPFAFGLPKPPIASAGHTAYDASLADAMSDYWVAFAMKGNPNSAGRPIWPVYDRETDAYMELGPQVVAKSALRRMAYDTLDAAGRARGDVRPWKN